MKTIKVIDEDKKDIFAQKVNDLTLRGYEISSTNCCYIGTSEWGEPRYQAILIKEQS